MKLHKVARAAMTVATAIWLRAPVYASIFRLAAPSLGFKGLGFRDRPWSQGRERWVSQLLALPASKSRVVLGRSVVWGLGFRV